jgi:hypothetical protein
VTESERIRVRIEEPQEDTSGRTGCLTIGAVLGIVAGTLFVLFGAGPLLNFLFPTDTIPVGESYHDDKLTMRVTRIASMDTDVDPGRHQGYLVEWDVEAKSSWWPHDACRGTDGGQELRGSSMDRSRLIPRDFVRPEAVKLVIFFGTGSGLSPL